MARARSTYLASFFCAVVLAAPALAQSPPQQSLDEVLAKMGATAMREVESDIALPTDSQEYEALGKNAVLMLTATTALPSELPLRSTYVEIGEVRVPLQRIAVLPAEAVTVERGQRTDSYTRQVAFYLVPVYLIARDAHLMVDFNGRREGFGVTRFRTSFLAGAPTFIRADDYGFPSEPDYAAVEAMTIREFPTVFAGPEAP